MASLAVFVGSLDWCLGTGFPNPQSLPPSATTTLSLRERVNVAYTVF